MRMWIAMLLVVGCRSSAPPEETEGPGGQVTALVCSKGSQRLGTLRFPKDGPPTLALEAQGPEGEAFKAAWEKLRAQGKVSVKVHQGFDDRNALVGMEAAPGDPLYGRLVEIKLLDDYSYLCHAER